MWSITATHPILRIFLYQYDASPVLSGSCDSHGSWHRSDPVTKPYQLLPWSCMWQHGQLGWSGFELWPLTNCYQTLPALRSGLTPPVHRLYQAPPPAYTLMIYDTMCYALVTNTVTMWLGWTQLGCGMSVSDTATRLAWRYVLYWCGLLVLGTLYGIGTTTWLTRV